MKNILPALFLASCVRLPAECKPQIEAVEAKCRAFGTQGNLDPELSKAKQCIGRKVEAICVQNNIAEPRQVKWEIQ